MTRRQARRASGDKDQADVRGHRQPRGGTSLLAGVLHRAGVYIGAFKTKQYEDPEFKIPPDRAFTPWRSSHR